MGLINYGPSYGPKSDHTVHCLVSFASVGGFIQAVSMKTGSVEADGLCSP